MVSFAYQVQQIGHSEPNPRKGNHDEQEENLDHVCELFERWQSDTRRAGRPSVRE